MDRPDFHRWTDLIFIGSNVNSVWPEIPTWFAITAVWPGLCLLATIRYLKHLAPFSLVADFGNIGGILMVRAVSRCHVWTLLLIHLARESVQ